MGEKKTYIINIDGMRADYFGACGNHQKCLTPTLVSLAKQGVQFTKCKDILPSVTATNHTAILTSTNLGTHGICGATAYYKGLDFSHLRLSPQHGTAQLGKFKHRHLQGLPNFFNIVKMNNKSSITAMVTGKHWVGEIFSDDKDLDILIYAGNSSNPDYVVSSHGHILGGEKHIEDSPFPPRFYVSRKRDQIVSPPKGTIRFMNADYVPSDKWIIDQTIQTICHQDPDFVYILLNNIDSAGHAYGSFTDIKKPDLNKLINPHAMMDQIFITDCELKRFIDFLERRHTLDESRIIITSDHGMSTMKRMREAVDIRKILKQNGIKIRANTKWSPFGYNDKGQYEWCFSEGTNIFIYCREENEKQIKEILEKKLPHLGEIIDTKDQIGKKMWKGNYDNVVWPRLIIFLKPNFMNVYYSDGSASRLKAVKEIPPHIQFLIAKVLKIPVAPGTHGTPSEQDVPLIFFSPSEYPTKENSSGSINVLAGTVVEHQVSILDIIPTINYLNNWPEQPTFEGKPLFKLSKRKQNVKK